MKRSVLVLVLVLGGCASDPPPPPKAIGLNRLGAAALASGDLPTAEARLAVAIEYSPKFTEAWVNLGLLALARGELAQARKTLAHARSLNQDLPTPHHALGLLEERCERTKQAEAHYRAALAVDPGFAPARVNLGRMLFTAGRYEEAREQFLRLTEVAPDVLEGWVGLAESLLRLGRERDSERTTDRARKRLGDRPDLVLLVAREMLRRGAFAEAETALAPLTAAGDRSRRASAWAWLSVARLGDGRTNLAEAAAEEALAADPSQAVARFTVDEIARRKLRVIEAE
jgi:tetratricopeptide (TPR) repeat protein